MFPFLPRFLILRKEPLLRVHLRLGALLLLLLLSSLPAIPLLLCLRLWNMAPHWWSRLYPFLVLPPKGPMQICLWTRDLKRFLRILRTSLSRRRGFFILTRMMVVSVRLRIWVHVSCPCQIFSFSFLLLPGTLLWLFYTLIFLATNILEEPKTATNTAMPTAPTFTTPVAPTLTGLGNFSFSHIFFNLHYRFILSLCLSLMLYFMFLPRSNSC